MSSISLSYIEREIRVDTGKLTQFECEIYRSNNINTSFCDSVAIRQKIINLENKYIEMVDKLGNELNDTEKNLEVSPWTKKKKIISIATLGLGYLLHYRRQHKKRMVELTARRSKLFNLRQKIEAEIYPRIKDLLESKLN